MKFLTGLLGLIKYAVELIRYVIAVAVTTACVLACLAVVFPANFIQVVEYIKNLIC